MSSVKILTQDQKGKVEHGSIEKLPGVCDERVIRIDLSLQFNPKRCGGDDIHCEGSGTPAVKAAVRSYSFQSDLFYQWGRKMSIRVM